MFPSYVQRSVHITNFMVFFLVKLLFGSLWCIISFVSFMLPGITCCYPIIYLLHLILLAIESV